MKVNKVKLFWPNTWNDKIKYFILILMIFCLVVNVLVDVLILKKIEFYFFIAALCVFYIERFIFDKKFNFYPGVLNYYPDDYFNQYLRFGLFVVFFIVYLICVFL